MQRLRTIRNSNHNPPGPDNTATHHLSGAHYLQEQLDIRWTDSYLTIRNYREEKVTLPRYLGIST